LTTAWILNTAGLFVTAVGALLIFLYVWRTPQFAAEWLTPEGKIAYAKHRRLLVIGVGLLAVWVMLQYLGVILL